MPVVQRVTLRSNVIRSLRFSSVLVRLQRQIITMRCRGYIFFGSARQILKEVMSSVAVYSQLSDQGLGAEIGKNQVRPPFLVSAHGKACTQCTGYGGVNVFYHLSNEPLRICWCQGPPTKFVIFDFTMVSGLDATAARSCFLNLCRTLTPLGVTLVFGGLRRGGRIERLLIGHEILHTDPLHPRALAFDTIDEALEFCEDSLLRDTTGRPSQAKFVGSCCSRSNPASAAESRTLMESKGSKPIPRGPSEGLLGVLSPLAEVK